MENKKLNNYFSENLIPHRQKQFRGTKVTQIFPPKCREKIYAKSYAEHKFKFT